MVSNPWQTCGEALQASVTESLGFCGVITFVLSVSGKLLDSSSTVEPKSWGTGSRAVVLHRLCVIFLASGLWIDEPRAGNKSAVRELSHDVNAGLQKACYANSTKWSWIHFIIHSHPVSACPRYSQLPSNSLEAVLLKSEFKRANTNAWTAIIPV